MKKIFYNRELAHVKLKHYQQAEQDFSHAFELNPRDVDSRYNRDLCRRLMGYRL